MELICLPLASGLPSENASLRGGSCPVFATFEAGGSLLASLAPASTCGSGVEGLVYFVRLVKRVARDLRAAIKLGLLLRGESRREAFAIELDRPFSDLVEVAPFSSKVGPSRALDLFESVISFDILGHTRHQ